MNSTEFVNGHSDVVKLDECREADVPDDKFPLPRIYGHGIPGIKRSQGSVCTYANCGVQLGSGVKCHTHGHQGDKRPKSERWTQRTYQQPWTACGIFIFVNDLLDETQPLPPNMEDLMRQELLVPFRPPVVEDPRTRNQHELPPYIQQLGYAVALEDFSASDLLPLLEVAPGHSLGLHLMLQSYLSDLTENRLNEVNLGLRKKLLSWKKWYVLSLL